MTHSLPWTLARTAPRPGRLPPPVHIGRYHLIEVLDQGPSGVTWLARADHRTWGLKLPLRADEECGLSLIREGEILSKINDMNVVRLIEQGRALDGRPYLVLEWLEGEPLDQHLRRVGHLAVPRALTLVRQLLSGLSAVHAHHHVLRDLRLSGLFLAREAGGREVLKLIDLGSALPKGTSVESPQPTPEPGVRPCDPRDDLYAVGVILYELVTGHPPFVEGRLEDPTGHVGWMHIHAQPPRPAVDLDGLWNLLLTLLEKRREDRFRSANAALEALERMANRPSFQQFLPVQRCSTDFTPVRTSDVAPGEWPERAARPLRRNLPWTWLGLPAALAAAVYAFV